MKKEKDSSVTTEDLKKRKRKRKKNLPEDRFFLEI